MTKKENIHNLEDAIMFNYKALKLKSDTTGELIVVGIYRFITRPVDTKTRLQTSIPNFIENMKTLINHDEIKNSKAIIAGDMNLNTLKDDRRGYCTKYKNLLQNHGWTENINEVTHVAGNTEGGTCIDHIITNKNFNETFEERKNFEKTKMDPEISDHKVTMAFWSKKDVQ